MKAPLIQITERNETVLKVFKEYVFHCILPSQFQLQNKFFITDLHLAKMLQENKTYKDDNKNV
jgi:hypothetical protein